MNYRFLGRSDLNISEIGFGCMSLGDDGEANSHLLHQALENGINFFDTADMYQRGKNEIAVGNALKEKRQQVIIATKVGNQWREDGSGWDWNPRKEYILSAVEKSLERLQTDYIDLYQLHGGTIDDPIDEVIEAFELLKQQGKILYYGISSIRPNVIREYVKRSGIVSVMMQYSLLDRRPEESCLDLLLENKIGVLARGTLAKGILVNKQADTYPEYNAAELADILNKFSGIVGKSIGKIAAALKFVTDHAVIASAITGIRTESHLKDIIEASNAILNSHTRHLLEELPRNYYKEHR